MIILLTSYAVIIGWFVVLAVLLGIFSIGYTWTTR